MVWQLNAKPNLTKIYPAKGFANNNESATTRP